MLTIIIYSIPPFFLYALSISETNKKKLYYPIIILLILFVYCFGYMTGSDWRNYETLYNTYSFENLLNEKKEVLFYFIVLISKNIGLSFFTFLIISKILVFIIYIQFFYKYSSDFLTSICLFLLFDALFIFVDNPLRFMFACGFLCLAIQCSINKHKIKAITLWLIAINFHISSLIYLLISIFLKFKFDKTKTRIIFTLFFILFNQESFIYLTKLVSTFIPEISTLLYFYIQTMKLNEYNLLVPSNIFMYALFLVVTGYEKDIKLHFNGNILYNSSIIWFFLFKIGTVIPVAFRFPIYLTPLLIITITYILNILPRYRYVLLSLIFFPLAIFNIKEINNSWVYFPYTNIFGKSFYLQETYEERSYFNRSTYYDRMGFFPKEWKAAGGKLFE